MGRLGYFLRGMASLSLYPVESPEVREILDRTDLDSIELDWRMVFRDLDAALDEWDRQ